MTADRDATVVEAARQVAAEVLAPAAESTDRAAVVPRANLRALADAGLFGLQGPPELGGVRPATFRQVAEVLGGACGVTTFVWLQHHSPVGLLGRTANAALRDRWLGSLCAGDAIGGTAFAFLRRPGPPLLRADPDGAGWRLTGVAPWATGWGLAAVFAVAAGTPDGRVVWALVPARPGPGLEAGPPLALAVMQATATVALRFDDLSVGDDQVAAVVPVESWRVLDERRAAQLQPPVLGLADACVRRLAPLRPEHAEALALELGAVRRAAAALASAVDAGGSPPVPVAELAALRARGLALAQRAALAHLAAVGGAGISSDHPAQRLVREAAFWVVQAQDEAGRVATLDVLAHPEGSRGPAKKN
ncbi:MAG: acyl-CoA/acyl-ACP dehydrogenase [Acidimicrobiales bacterium]|nr:acyl-CoA/acyl-ACP dehydrogenase [Acidimicrobiales bacterium]